MAATDLGVERVPRWVGAVRMVQWLLITAALVGGAWLLALGVIGWMRLPELPTPSVGVVPLPTLLLVGGVLLGVLLALLSRALVGVSARRRADAADERLRAAVREVATELVVQPVARELQAHATLRDSLGRVLG